MKKIFMYTILTVSLIACKKEETKPTTEDVYSIRIEAVDNDGTLTYSQEAYIKVKQ